MLLLINHFYLVGKNYWLVNLQKKKRKKRNWLCFWLHMNWIQYSVSLFHFYTCLCPCSAHWLPLLPSLLPPTAPNCRLGSTKGWNAQLTAVNLFVWGAPPHSYSRLSLLEEVQPRTPLSLQPKGLPCGLFHCLSPPSQLGGNWLRDL